MDNLALSSGEQMQGISPVCVTQNNTALVQESSAASQSLLGQARALRGMAETSTVSAFPGGPRTDGTADIAGQ